jgi:pimeloyl-ACP methyl ester carboxylesterase
MNLIYLHGFCSSPASDKADFFAARLRACGVHVVVPDLNGESFTRMTLTEQLQIVAAEAARLNGPLCLMGSSLGAFVAALFAQREARVERLICMAPAFGFYQRFLARMPLSQQAQWRCDGTLMVEHYAYKREVPLNYVFVEDAQQYDQWRLDRTLPALVMHGLRDETVSWHAAESYLQANPLAELVLYNADHSLFDVKPQMWRQVRAFLQLDEKG